MAMKIPEAKQQKFRKISLHNGLITRVEKVVKERGYRSIAEFISEAARLRMEQLQKEGI